MKATVFNISRCSMHDGEGLRTVVYLKGCSMRCLWCHNPESWNKAPELLFYPERCIGCGRCADKCGRDAHRCDEDGHKLLRDRCIVCGQCAEACPSGALEICGRNMSVDEVMQVVLRDRHYYEKTGGGVTFSGGECLLWPDFMRAVMAECRQEGINITVETALNVKWENVKATAGYVDAFYCDIKHPDSVIHKKFTGTGNELILNNLGRLSVIHNNIIVRVPLIPGVNDDDSCLMAIARIVNGYNGVKGIELLKYNNLAAGKGKALGCEMKQFGEPQDDEVMEQKKSIVREVLETSKLVF